MGVNQMGETFTTDAGESLHEIWNDFDDASQEVYEAIEDYVDNLKINDPAARERLDVALGLLHGKVQNLDAYFGDA